MTRDNMLAYIEQWLEFRLYGVEVNDDGNIAAWDALCECEIEIVIHSVLDIATVESALDLYDRRMSEPSTDPDSDVRYPCGLLIWIVAERAEAGVSEWVKECDDLWLVWARDLTAPTIK